MSGLTQRQLAKLAKVSQATVSRVLNHDPRVNSEARSRVMQIMTSHDYVPDARAQSLRGQRSGALGLVVHRDAEYLAQDPFFSALIIAILQVAGQRGYHLVVETARDVRLGRAVHEELLRTRRIDGLVLVESQAQDERIERLLDWGFPFVLIGRYDPDPAVLSVDNDNIEAGRLVTARLLAQGRQRIAYIGGPKGLTVSEDRLHGYHRALASKGIIYDPTLVRYSDFTEKGGYKAMSGLLAMNPPPDALVAVDDLTAVGAVRAAQAMSCRIPEELGVTGFNDSLFCPYFNPPLSSVSIDITALAREATEMLIARVEGCEVGAARRIIPCKLIERASTGS